MSKKVSRAIDATKIAGELLAVVWMDAGIFLGGVLVASAAGGANNTTNRKRMIPGFAVMHPVVVVMLGLVLFLVATAIRGTSRFTRPAAARFTELMKWGAYWLGGLLVCIGSMRLAFDYLAAVIVIGIALVLAPLAIRDSKSPLEPGIKPYAAQGKKSMRLLGALLLCSCVPAVLMFLLVVFVTGLPNGG